MAAAFFWPTGTLNKDHLRRVFGALPLVHHRGIGRHRRDVRDLVARPVAALPVLQGPSPSSAAQQAPPSEPRRRSMSLRNGSRLSGSKFSGWASIQAIVRSQYSIASSARATGSSRAGLNAETAQNSRAPPLDPVGPQAPPTRGPPPAAHRARRPARGALPWTTGTSYRRASGTLLRRRAGTYSSRR